MVVPSIHLSRKSSRPLSRNRGDGFVHVSVLIHEFAADVSSGLDAALHGGIASRKNKKKRHVVKRRETKVKKKIT